MYPECHALLSKAEAFEVIDVIENVAAILDGSSYMVGVKILEDVTALLLQRLFPEDVTNA